MAKGEPRILLKKIILVSACWLLLSGCKTTELVVISESHDSWIIPKRAIFEAIDKDDRKHKKIRKYVAPCDLIAVGKGDYLELERKANEND